MISVVIPMYNASETILSSLKSVLNQSYTGEIEIIIVDDGSTDSSFNIVNQFIKNNKSKSISIINKTNGGVSTARNVGMKAAKGEFIAFLDSDDIWEHEKLEKQMEILLGNKEIILLGCNRNNEDISNFFFKKFSRLTRISSRLLLYKNFFSTPTVIIRKEVLMETGFFDETQRYAEEGNYWIRICKEGKCMLLNESYVLTGGGKPDFGFSGLSSNLKEMERGELKNIKDALNLKIIGRFEYCFLISYSILKYLRRVIIVKLR